MAGDPRRSLPKNRGGPGRRATSCSSVAPLGLVVGIAELAAPAGAAVQVAALAVDSRGAAVAVNDQRVGVGRAHAGAG